MSSAATQNPEKRKNIMAAVLGVLALGAVIYGYNELFGGSGPPPPHTPPVITNSSRSSAARSNAAPAANNTGLGAAPGVAATLMASASSGLDPTLHEDAMHRTESLVYTGSGRNIFSLVYTPPAPPIPKVVPNPRVVSAVAPIAPVVLGPSPLPPINLKFFGVAERASGVRQAFLLDGDNVYLASEGDIVARKYKVLKILPSSIQVEDLSNQNTQTLPLHTN